MFRLVSSKVHVIMTAIAMSFVEAQVTRVVIAAVGVASTGATHKIKTLDTNLDVKSISLFRYSIKKFHFLSINKAKILFRSDFNLFNCHLNHFKVLIVNKTIESDILTYLKEI